jgi:hypothetical protein
MYPILLVVHSWVRWAAIAGVVIVFVRAIRGVASSARWGGADTKWIKGAAHLLTGQALIGVLLYLLSPYIQGLLADMANTMRDRESRLFAVEHAVVMILVLGLAHMGSAMARKGATDKTKFTRAAVFFGIIILLMGYAIPWMRPMWRFGV